MCINFETSFVSLVIGEFVGLFLILENKNNSNNYEKICIGLFVMFYSLIQFFELMLYKNKCNNSIVYKNLLILNLSFQGLLFFVLMSLIMKINKIFIILCCLTLFLIIYQLITNFTDENLISCNSNCLGLNWNFMSNNNISINLGIMYFIIFFWIFTENSSKFILNVGLILFGTLIFSFFIQNSFNNSPSIWCMSSAIASPLFLLL
jgi:hypothetical protein